jgi:hypothetical protein
MRENMWVIQKVKVTRHPCYSADNFLHSDRRLSEGELSTSVGGKYIKSLSTLYHRVTKNGYEYRNDMVTDDPGSKPDQRHAWWRDR